MTTTNTINGRRRTSLAEQLDRLDGILDGLADALNESVAAAVQEAVGRAVKEAIQAVFAEVLSNPDVLARLHGSAGPAPEPTAPVPESAAAPAPRGWLGRARSVVAQGAAAVRGACAGCTNWMARAVGAAAGRARTACAAVRRGLGVLWPCRGQVVVALAVGTMAAVAAYYAGPWLCAGAAWLGAFATTLAVQAGAALRRALGHLVPDGPPSLPGGLG
jgi:hypothetical protein